MPIGWHWAQSDPSRTLVTQVEHLKTVWALVPWASVVAAIKTAVRRKPSCPQALLFLLYFLLFALNLFPVWEAPSGLSSSVTTTSLLLDTCEGGSPHLPLFRVSRSKQLDLLAHAILCLKTLCYFLSVQNPIASPSGGLPSHKAALLPQTSFCYCVCTSSSLRCWQITTRLHEFTRTSYLNVLRVKNQTVSQWSKMAMSPKLLWSSGGHGHFLVHDLFLALIRPLSSLWSYLPLTLSLI